MPEIPTLRAQELFLRSQPRHLPTAISEKIVPSDHSAPQNPETTREIRRILLEAITITRWSASQLAVTDRRFAR